MTAVMDSPTAATPIPQAADPGAPAQLLTSEGSQIARVVALITPLFAVVAGSFAAWVAKHTGAKLDSSQITAFMVAAVTTVLAAAWKWLQGWQQHERLVAEGKATPVKAKS